MLPEDRDRVPVLELISSKSGADALFPANKGQWIRQSSSSQKIRNFPETKGASVAAWEYSFKSLTQGRLTTAGSSYSHLTWETREGEAPMPIRRLTVPTQETRDELLDKLRNFSEHH